jgi:transcription initiation factor TFIIB
MDAVATATTVEQINEEPDDKLWNMFDTIRSRFDSGGDTCAGTEVADDDVVSCINKTCDGTEFPVDEGNYVCTKCRTVQDRLIDYGAEWRYYGNEDSKSADPTRCGMPTSEYLPGMSLGSVISTEGRLNKYMYRLARYQKFNSIPYRERNLFNIIDTMALKAINGGISNSIIEEAKMLYKKISELKLSRGSNREGMIASSIYYSCKKNNVARSAKEIAKIFNLSVSVMTDGCKRFDDIMCIDAKSTTAEDFIKRFCSRLDFTQDMVETCIHVVKKQCHYGIISENSPPSVAAGCIYLVNFCHDLGRTKKEIAQACEISEITITKCFKKLHEYRMFILPM